jgi:hypothetical protein
MLYGVAPCVELTEPGILAIDEADDITDEFIFLPAIPLSGDILSSFILPPY